MLFQLLADAFWVVLAVLLAFQLRGVALVPRLTTVAPALVFAVLMTLVLGAFGLYRRDRKIGLAAYAFRLVLAMLIAVPVAYYTADGMPGGRPFQETASDWVLLAFAGLVLVRQLISGHVLKLVVPHFQKLT
jgi:FlaA1/EpsC-like NDP-sugar epimerase